MQDYYLYVTFCQYIIVLVLINTDTWEQRKLNEVAEFNPKSELPDEFEYVDLESVVGTEMKIGRAHV